MDRIETVATIRTALCLFSSMIKGGEQHSQTSMGAFHEAMNALEAIAAQTPQWSDEVPTEPGWYWQKTVNGKISVVNVVERSHTMFNSFEAKMQYGVEESALAFYAFNDPRNLFASYKWAKATPPEGG